MPYLSSDQFSHKDRNLQGIKERMPLSFDIIILAIRGLFVKLNVIFFVMSHASSFSCFNKITQIVDNGTVSVLGSISIPHVCRQQSNISQKCKLVQNSF